MKKKELIQTLYYIVEMELRKQVPKVIQSEIKRSMKPLLKEIVILRQENKILEHNNRSLILINEQSDQKIETPDPNISQETDPIKKILNETTLTIPSSETEQGFQTMGEYTSTDIHKVAAGSHVEEPINKELNTTFGGISVPKNELTNLVILNMNKDYSNFMKSVNEKVISIQGPRGNDGDR